MAALLGAAAAALACAQPPRPTTEGQARYYVYGAFLTHAVPEIMGENVALGPELEQRLGLKPGADRLQIYDALMTYTDGKRLAVRKATAEEVARYKPQAKRELKEPVFAVHAGEITLLVEYDMQANAIPFVGQLGAAYQPPRSVAPAPKPPPPVVERRAVLTAPAAAAPKPASPPPVATAAPKPVPLPVKPAPVKPVARAAPVEALRPNGPCAVKPVMSEQDLANCRAAPAIAARVQPGPPIVARPQARVEPVAPQRAGPCEVKPVMTEEDMANCRNAPGGAARVQPGPPVVAKPQAASKPAVEPVSPPRRTGPCEVKPVMTEEDLANCRNAPGGAARVQPGPPPAAVRSAAPSPAPAVRPPAVPCVIRPVMSEEDRIACGMR